MTREEFIKVIGYITAGSGKTLSPESLAVYFDCLGDLPFDTLATAAKRVLMEHKWATFPSIAELREAAAETQRHTLKELTAGEAWAIAWKIAGRTDPEVQGSYARAAKDEPPLVLEAIEAYGLMDLCYGKEPVGVVRGQFMKIFEHLASREKRRALMPPALAERIEGKPALQRLAARIGEMNSNGTL